MCIAVVKQAGIALDEEELRNCFRSNRDGAGYAYRDAENRIVLNKGFFVEDNFVQSAMESIPLESEALLHCRIATHGLKDAGNTHPFIVAKEHELLRQLDGTFSNYAVMIHNGVFNKAIPSFEEKVLSDSQEFIRKFLSDAFILEGLYDNPTLREFFKDFISTSKVAILHPNKGLLWFGKFEESNGILYSNSGYIRKIYTKVCTYYENWRGWGTKSTQTSLLPSKPEKGYCDFCERYTENLLFIDGSPLCQQCHKAITSVL